MYLKLQRGSSAQTLTLRCKSQALVPVCSAWLFWLRICCRSISSIAAFMPVLEEHVLPRLADHVVRPVLCPCFAADCCLWGSGAYLCVKGYGSTASTYALRADYTRCPSDFTDDGQEMMCSSLVSAPESGKRYTGCSADGMCTCKPPYQKPLPEVYEGKSHGAVNMPAECRRLSC